MLPSYFLKIIGVCLLAFGIYDTNVYWYTLRTGRGTFNFFGRRMPANHRAVRLGFSLVFIFYYAIGSVLIILG